MWYFRRKQGVKFQGSIFIFYQSPQPGINKPNGILAFGRPDKSAEIIRKNDDKIVCNLNISDLHFVSIMYGY